MRDERVPPTTTTESGIPVASDDKSLTVGPTGPTVLHDAYVVQKMQQFNRKRVPERVAHAKGGGASKPPKSATTRYSGTPKTTTSGNLARSFAKCSPALAANTSPTTSLPTPATASRRRSSGASSNTWGNVDADLGNTVAGGLRYHAMAASAGDGAGPDRQS
jgi:hypothetical protein